MIHYIKFMVVFIFPSLILVCTASYLIDPYGIYPDDKDYFPRKVAAADKGRTIKPYQALNNSAFTVLVGNSRVEIGMPTEHAFYQAKPVYNMGLPGAGISMQYGYAMHAINQSDSVKQVVIALDFLDFTSRADNIVTTMDNSGWQWRLEALNSERFADKRRYLAERISLLFSLSALTDSVKTIVAQQSNVNALNRFGFNDGRVYHFHVASEGFGALYQQKAQEIDQRLSTQQLVFNRHSFHLKELDSFITQLKQQNITVYLLINPYQQPYLDQLTEHKLEEHLFAWKEQMIELAKHHQLALFDFAISSSLVIDVVKPNSKVAEDSPYFWEPAHYRPAFGDLILNSLLINNCHQICKLYSQ